MDAKRLTTPVLVVATWLILPACAVQRPMPPPAASAGAPPDETVDPEAARLAERAQRDVEQIKQYQAGAAEGQRAAAAPSIDWILPGLKPAGEPAVQEPLARPGALPSAPPLPPQTAGAAGPDPAPAAVEPAPAVADPAIQDRLDQLIVDLSAELYRRGAHSDMPLREMLAIAAMSIVEPDRPFEPGALPSLTERERELLTQIHEWFKALGRDLVDGGDPEAIVAAVESLRKGLAQEPRLLLPTAKLCSRVSGFGDYDEFAVAEGGTYTFLADSGQQAVIYVEIEDFASRLNEKGQWVTEISQQLVIYSDRDGIPVWREDWQAGVDASRNRREDFFVVQVVTLPKRLSVGRYQLKVRVRDEASGAEAETAISFEMVADPRMAG